MYITSAGGRAYPTLRHKGTKVSEKNWKWKYSTYIRTYVHTLRWIAWSCAHLVHISCRLLDLKVMLLMPLKYRLALILIPDPIPLVLQSFQGFYSLLHIVHCTQSRDYSSGMVESHTAYGNGIHVSLQRSNTEITWLIAVCIVLSQRHTYVETQLRTYLQCM